MTRITSCNQSVPGNSAQQIMQSIHSWRQAGLVERASSRQCDQAERSSARLEEKSRRARSTHSSSSAVALILCAAMLPSALCTYGSSAGIDAAKFRHSVLLDTHVPGASKLKKSVSFSSKMDQAILPSSHKCSADLDYISNVYTPVHSSSDLEGAAGDRVQSMRLRGQVRSLSSSSVTGRRSLSSGDVAAAAPYVYTRLQTQLFPQMRF